ncbi:MAG: hypothetical protein ACLGIN_07525 [Candidatus Sericytochromatia bacterium]
MLEVQDVGMGLVLVGAGLGWLLMLAGIVYMANSSLFRRAAPPEPAAPEPASIEGEPAEPLPSIDEADRPMAVVISDSAPRPGREP